MTIGRPFSGASSVVRRSASWILEGVRQASYALKLLQSDGCLRIANTGKHPGTGRAQTETYQVEGPVMMFLTTTSPRPDEELHNRCLTLQVNESPEQTQAIHSMASSSIRMVS